MENNSSSNSRFEFGAAILAGIAGIAVGAIGMSVMTRYRPTSESKSSKSSSAGNDLDCAYGKLVGNTALVKLNALSEALDCDIFVKMENLNPGGTGKDRVAKSMLEEATTHPRYRAGCDIVEGTSGSTGIALACLCRARNLQLHVVMPDDQAQEKRVLLEKLGAKVVTVPSCGIANSDHYVNSARRLADELNGIFLNQFENLANYRVHYSTTGPEIWIQTHGVIDAFVMSSGTGGTIAGVSKFLKEQNPDINVILADPEGSSLLNKVKYGVCFTKEQTERGIKKHRYDSIVEGVGLDRTTANFAQASIDDAFRGSDQEVLEMAHWLLRYEGLFVGSSSALNLVAVCKYVSSMKMKMKMQTQVEGRSQEQQKRRPVIVSVICDSGHRHLSRLWSPEYIKHCAETGLYGSPTAPLSWPDADRLSRTHPPGLKPSAAEGKL